MLGLGVVPAACLAYAVIFIMPGSRHGGSRAARARGNVWQSKFYGAFVLILRVNLHAIDATPARWRGAPDSLVDFHTGVEEGRARS